MTVAGWRSTNFPDAETMKEFWITADNSVMDFSKIKSSKFDNKSLKELQMHGKTMSFGFIVMKLLFLINQKPIRKC
jgi:hypothetical protein